LSQFKELCRSTYLLAHLGSVYSILYIWLMYFVIGFPLCRVSVIIPSIIKLCNTSQCVSNVHLQSSIICFYILLLKASINNNIFLLSLERPNFFFLQSFYSLYFSPAFHIKSLYYVFFFYLFIVHISFHATLQTYDFISLLLMNIFMVFEVKSLFFLRNMIFFLTYSVSDFLY
jgi:hypothetical protein